MTQTKLKALFDYSPDGYLISKYKRQKCVAGQKVFGYLRKDGYCVISIYETIYKAHRLVFLWHHGFLPERIDHVNGNRSDNRIENLREADNAQNMRNSKIRVDNKTGFRGVTRRKHKSKINYRAKIRLDGKLVCLGTFVTKEEAARAYDEMARKHYREFARPNFSDSMSNR